MSKFTVHCEGALTALKEALEAIGAVGVEVSVLGSVGNEYGYEVTYEGEGDDREGWVYPPPRIIEVPMIDDASDDTLSDTKELDLGFIDQTKAA